MLGNTQSANQAHELSSSHRGVRSRKRCAILCLSSLSSSESASESDGSEEEEDEKEEEKEEEEDDDDEDGEEGAADLGEEEGIDDTEQSADGQASVRQPGTGSGEGPNSSVPGRR